MAPKVTLDLSTHSYHLGGRWVPGVTNVLADSGYYPASPWYTEDSRRRGTAVHLACQLTDDHCPTATCVEDVLEKLDLAEPLHPYVAGWILCKRELRLRTIWSELAYGSSKLRVGGLIDKYCVDERGRRIVVDLKSWANPGPICPRSAEIQTGGYEVVLVENDVPVDGRLVVALPGDGRYRSYPCEDDRDGLIFTYATQVWWDRYDSKLLKPAAAPAEVED